MIGEKRLLPWISALSLPYNKWQFIYKGIRLDPTQPRLITERSGHGCRWFGSVFLAAPADNRFTAGDSPFEWETPLGDDYLRRDQNGLVIKHMKLRPYPREI